MLFVVSLIRHGQSLNNALPDSQRVDDPGLTDLGKRQAEHLGYWQPELPVQHLFCSPFLRSLETTVPLAAQTGILPAIRADLFEQRRVVFGEAGGLVERRVDLRQKARGHVSGAGGG